MDATTRFPNLFQSLRPLAEVVWNFNFDIAGYAHPSWADRVLPPNAFSLLRDCPRTRPRLNALLLRTLADPSTPCFDFDTPLLRLALLPSDVLAQTAFLIGTGLLAPRIRLVIDASEVKAIRNALGVAAYEFALKRFSLLCGPDIGEPKNGLPEPDKLVETVICLGQEVLTRLMDDAPAPVRTRARLKFAMDSPESVEQLSESLTGQRGVALTVKIVSGEVAPSWAHLFS
jgi:hypothetical protein